MALTASERRGRAVYAREGCAYCHTQQVRYLHQDMQRFGAPTLAWETHADMPHLWGTRRIGPDLARESGVAAGRLASRAPLRAAHHRPRLGDAALPAPVHAAAPTGRRRRRVTSSPTSRPSAASASSPGPKARRTRGRRATARATTMRRMAFEAAAINVHPARAAPHRRGAGAAGARLPTATERGRQVYAAECAGCHGADGKGRAWRRRAAAAPDRSQRPPLQRARPGPRAVARARRHVDAGVARSCAGGAGRRGARRCRRLAPHADDPPRPVAHPRPWPARLRRQLRVVPRRRRRRQRAGGGGAGDRAVRSDRAAAEHERRPDGATIAASRARRWRRGPTG